MNTKTKKRAFPIIPNKNICIHIRSILAIQSFYEKLNFVRFLELVQESAFFCGMNCEKHNTIQSQ